MLGEGYLMVLVCGPVRWDHRQHLKSSDPIQVREVQNKNGDGIVAFDESRWSLEDLVDPQKIKDWIQSE